MTKSFLALKDYPALGATAGDLLVQSEKSAQELAMDKLVANGTFKELNEAESLALYKQQGAHHVA